MSESRCLSPTPHLTWSNFYHMLLIYTLYRKNHSDWNEHFGVYLSQSLLHVSAYQRHHQEAHMILTSYLYVGVHKRKNNGISSEVGGSYELPHVSVGTPKHVVAFD
jgi:hypothetical protein